LVFELRTGELRPGPFPHVVIEDYLPASVYEEMERTFPTCPPRSGPTGYTSFWGDADYDALMAANPTWKAAFDSFHSQQLVDFGRRQFGQVFADDGCRVDLDAARFVPFRETREDKERRRIAPNGLGPEDVWARMDALQGWKDYVRGPHLDHRRRLFTILIYFTDAESVGMDGGDLVLHDLDGSGPGAPVAAITPRRNLMAAFPCSPRSYHSVSKILSDGAPRNFIQIQLSSSADAWDR
jgi:hypothetical protein